jgi:flagellar biosynthesis/type III secretory pathway M-ring protein FliF/YscJ
LPLLGGDKDIYAKSEFGSSSLWWLWIVLGVVLIVGVAAVIAAIVLGKRQSKQAVSDAAAQYPQPAVAPTADSDPASEPDQIESGTADDTEAAEDPAEDPIVDSPADDADESPEDEEEAGE